MQNGTFFGDIDLLAGNHGIDALAQSRLFCKIEKQPQASAVMR